MPDHDPAAVDAGKELHKQLLLVGSEAAIPGSAYTKDLIDAAADIITDAYSPRLTAEREVREELVAVAMYSDCECDTYKGATETCHRCIALAAAEKLNNETPTETKGSNHGQ